MTRDTESRLERIELMLASLAGQDGRNGVIGALRKSADDHETRIRVVETAQTKAGARIGVIVGLVVGLSVSIASLLLR